MWVPFFCRLYKKSKGENGNHFPKAGPCPRTGAPRRLCDYYTTTSPSRHHRGKKVFGRRRRVSGTGRGIPLPMIGFGPGIPRQSIVKISFLSENRQKTIAFCSNEWYNKAIQEQCSSMLTEEKGVFLWLIWTD